MAALRRLLVWLVLAWLCAGPARAATSELNGLCAQRMALTQATRLLEGPDAPRRALVPVPDRLDVADRSESVRRSYTLDVSACAGQPAAALWLYRIGAPYRVTDDAGRPLDMLSARALLGPQLLLGALAGRPAADVWNGRIPALFALPADVRQVTITLLGTPYLPTGLVRAELGPMSSLLAAQAEGLQEAVAYSDAGSGVMLVLGLLAGLLGLQRRRDDGLLWLAGACILWGVRGLVYYDHPVHGAPLAFEQFNPLNVLLSCTCVALGILSLLGLAGRTTRLGLAATTAACGSLLVLSVLFDRGTLPARAIAFGCSLAMLTACLVLIVRSRWDLHAWHGPVLALALVALLGCALHDMGVVAGVLAPDSPTYVFWGFITLMISFAAISGHYVVQTLGRAEQANQELEQAIATKTSQLEASYALLRDAERERAQAQAREHLLREMHDGIGAQLMTTLRGLERAALSPDQVRDALQDGLDELRLLMDSGDIGRTLGGALAAWRNRWDPRLDALGLRLRWQVEAELDDVTLDPEAVLQVMRILQEAVTNVVKHARAASVHVQVWRERAGRMPLLRLDITDDGQGLPAAEARSNSGRGLANMHTRARVLDAMLTLQALPQGGTAVRLRVPLGMPQAEAA